MRDEQLIARVRARAPGAFDELYHAHVQRVHRQLFSIMGPDPDLDDLVQTTFVQVHQQLHAFRGEAQFGTWLHRIVVNVALAHLRKRQRWTLTRRAAREEVDANRTQSPELPSDVLHRRELLLLLYRALNDIRPQQRIVFVLYEVEGHTLEEIAELVSAPLNTVAARLRAARQQVRRKLAGPISADLRVTQRLRRSA